MRSIQVRPSIKLRSDLLNDVLTDVGSGNIVLVPFHAQGSTAAKALATHAGPWKGGTPTPAFDDSDEASIGGTTTNIWTRSGYITPVDNYIVDKSDTGNAMMNLKNCAGGILIMGDWRLPAVPSAREIWYDMGGTASSAGCFSGQIGTSGGNAWMYLQYRSSTTGPSDIVSVNLSSAGMVGGSRFHVGHYWDSANAAGSVLLNGSIATSGSGAFLSGTKPIPSATVRGCTLFCKGNTAAPNTSPLGGAGSGAAVANMVMLRFDTDRSGDIAAICQEAYQHWGEFLHTLRRVA